jgi:hypothetical protein
MMTTLKMAGMNLPKELQTPQTVTIFDDGKTILMQGMTFTKL